MDKRGLLIIVLALLVLGGALLAAGCSGDSTEPEPTIATDTPETTAAPTATPSPGTPPAIDTSAWLTYASPYHGFSIMYPPDWRLDAPRQEFQPVYVRNPQFVVAQEQRRADGIRAHFTPQLGEAWFQVVAGPPIPFDVDDLSTICGGSTTETNLKAFRVVLCSSGTMWVERPDGGVLQIAIENVGQDVGTARIIETIRGTLTIDQE